MARVAQAACEELADVARDAGHQDPHGMEPTQRRGRRTIGVGRSGRPSCGFGRAAHDLMARERCSPL